MTRQRDDQGGPRIGGRSGNDYLARGSEGYESWAAEGPSGITAEGGLGADVPALQNTDTWRAPVATSAPRDSRDRGSNALTLLVGVGVGAALMYFLDRERGAGRRQQAAGALMGAVRSGRRAAQGAVEQVRDRVGGRSADRSTKASTDASGLPTGIATATVVADVDDPLDLPSGDGDGRLALP